jgi:hypothetical protein
VISTNISKKSNLETILLILIFNFYYSYFKLINLILNIDIKLLQVY